MPLCLQQLNAEAPSSRPKRTKRPFFTLSRVSEPLSIFDVTSIILFSLMALVFFSNKVDSLLANIFKNEVRGQKLKSMLFLAKYIGVEEAS